MCKSSGCLFPPAFIATGLDLNHCQVRFKQSLNILSFGPILKGDGTVQMSVFNEEDMLNKQLVTHLNI